MKRKKKKKKILEFIDNLDIEFASEIEINDLIKNSNVNIINQEINTKALGNQKIEVKYTNLDNKEVSKSIDINIVDKTNPVIMASSTREIEKGDKTSLTKGIVCADNYDSKIECTVEGDYDINKIGEYSLKYVAVDVNNNKTEKEFKLVVKNKITNSSSSNTIYMKDIIKNYKNDNTEIGIDVSRWQGNDINFNKVKNSGVSFVMLRMGLQNGYGGDYELDRYFKINIEKALKTGLKVGVYFYSYADSKEEAIKQANWIVDNIKEYNITLPIAFDWEDWSNYNKLDLNLIDFNEIAYTFMDTIESKGYESILYGSKNYLEKIWNPKDYKIWLAHYTDKTTYDREYMMWQLTNCGNVDGIYGYVDIDIMNIENNEN